MKTINEIFNELKTEELIQIARELNKEFIPTDSLCRKVTAEVYVGIDFRLTHLLGLAPILALELANRLEYNENLAASNYQRKKDEKWASLAMKRQIEKK